MIRFKQSFGNDIKCRIEGYYMVSTYEINLLAARSVKGILKIQTDKSGGFSFQGSSGKSIVQCMEQGMSQQQLVLVAGNVVRIHLEAKKLGLGTNRLIWNPEWMYINEENADVSVIYLPVNGVAVNYDIVVFLKELIHLAKLEGREKDIWLSWLQDIEKRGISTESLDKIKSFQRRRREDVWNSMNGSVSSSMHDDYDDSKTEIDDEGEPLTGMDDDDFGGEFPTSMDDGWSVEPPTGMDDDDEIPTGKADDFGWGGMDKVDGTIIESTSESGYYESAKVPVLVRLSTGEKVAVNKAEFKIGRSAQRADYCIVGNSSISNVHAVIRKQGKDYFLSDNHSTNGTYVDGRKVEANGSQVRLSNGCIIKVWNEELEFRL